MSTFLKMLVVTSIVLALLLSGCQWVAVTTDGASTTGSSSEQTTLETTTSVVTSSTGTAVTTIVTTAPTTVPTTASTANYVMTTKRDLLVMLLAYPDDVLGVEQQSGQVFLVMASGTRLLYDDQRAKTIDEKYSDADIQDMLEVSYPLTQVDTLMPEDVDPGRYRCYALLNELYGSTKTAISANLVTVDWGTQHLPFNQQAAASAALLAIAEQTAQLAATKPETAAALYPSSGTFNYRVIAGTDRLSPHAYAMAIDINSTDGGYWRWMDYADGAQLLANYPQDVVRIFEDNNFIWGGKWHHFDLFHFEYRPEILHKARCFAATPGPGQPWYQGADLDDAAVQRAIDKIEAVLG